MQPAVKAIVPHVVVDDAISRVGSTTQRITVMAMTRKTTSSHVKLQFGVRQKCFHDVCKQSSLPGCPSGRGYTNTDEILSNTAVHEGSRESADALNQPEVFLYLWHSDSSIAVAGASSSNR